MRGWRRLRAVGLAGVSRVRIWMLRAIVGCVPICVCSNSLDGGRSEEKNVMLDDLLRGEKKKESRGRKKTKS